MTTAELSPELGERRCVAHHAYETLMKICQVDKSYKIESRGATRVSSETGKTCGVSRGATRASSETGKTSVCQEVQPEPPVRRGRRAVCQEVQPESPVRRGRRRCVKRCNQSLQ